MALVNITTVGCNQTRSTLGCNFTYQKEKNNSTNIDWTKIGLFFERLEISMKILLTFIIISTILGNTMVLIATWKERSLHQPNKYFIACLAVADLLVGLVLAPLKVYQMRHDNVSRSKMSIHLCRFMVWIDTFALTTSIYTLTFISFDRYLKISKPLQYKSLMTSSIATKVIFIIIFISTAFATYSATPQSGSSGILITGNGPCLQADPREYYLLLFISVFLLPILVISIMYALIFLVAHRRQKRWQNGELGQTSTNLNEQTATLRQDMKVIRMLVIIMGVFILCWSPWFVLISYLLFGDLLNLNKWYKNMSDIYWGNIIYQAANTLPLFNSLCNPIIYAWLDQKYREAFKHLFRQTVSWFRSRIR
ncbi:trace amine-associated receptor 3-like [Dendronephthya gigantea]|uniref:trace amine-associated receptor 3-like n=1 Tax=Dendronephthya gigantea TaxID=151771 RepID=UPI00106AB14A|nr:trace amine-associated receptor 3-like [Dendronephthya gigantea]